MKKFVVAVLVLFVSASVTYGQETKTPVNKNAPVMTFSKKLIDESGSVVWDYGTIQKDGDGNSYFTFVNTGKEPLILSDVRSSCGCTVPKWPREPILPGQIDTIKVRYDTKRLGIINKTITVMSNANNSPIILRIKGKIIEAPKAVLPERQAGVGPVVR
ncbi:MAG TPA: hypothetical protein DCR43_08935 [Bacteroidales bacterium]|nr:MAG: hypothetical protein A2X11_05060 [Bacteroidetes bacterium GWE2_42_24]OFY26611.1 MAG: hypothetical protein A2X09_03510 [Bacteroidetes bacterium GWF2_43_11]PKP15958.1 MAG: hypothetical protein CVU06_15580 [Bacteroidetes bacterium HGW-Bacteroidetes-22]HAQ65957.1 hypothetical protein [Bacteroidales bacterium]HBZ67493.1 hypothetical protein [Bacteroidales bacterium]